MQERLKAKQRAKRMLIKAHKARQEMSLYTSEAISQRHGLSKATVKNLKAGRDPDTIPASVKTNVLMDLMRQTELGKSYKSLDAIALDVCVSRSLVRKWSKEFGLTRSQPERPKPEPVKEPVKPLWTGTAIGRFMTMRLTRCPAKSVPGYY